MNIHEVAVSETDTENRDTHPKPVTGMYTEHWERAVLALLVLALVFGLAIDTRSHRVSPKIESFFTRSHAVGYAAGTATSVFLLYLVRKRQRPGQRFFDAIPIGLQASLAGIGMYLFGGLGDLWWHTAYGIEQDLKILFSPTHLMLMCAMLMLAFGPLRSAWGDPRLKAFRWGGIARFWPIALVAGCMATVLNIFFTYASPFEQPVFTARIPPLLGRFSEFLQLSATMAIFAHTIIFFGISLLMMRRWELPPGTFLVMFAVVAGAMWIYFDWTWQRTIWAMLAGALCCEAINAALLPLKYARIRYRVFAVSAPWGFWIAYLLVTKQGDPINWTREQWTGTIVWTGIIGIGLSLLLLPPRNQPTSYLD